MMDVSASFQGSPIPKPTVVHLIEAAVQAGALREACRQYPESADALGAAAEWHSRKVARLALEIWTLAKDQGRL